MAWALALVADLAADGAGVAHGEPHSGAAFERFRFWPGGAVWVIDDPAAAFAQEPAQVT
jgi:hypothetical protein